MNRFIIIIISFIMTLSQFLTVNAQTTTENKAPDMAKIREFANSREYNKLMKRFERNDQSMSITDYRHLYFGYIFQPEYNPYNREDHSKSISTLYYKERLNRLECDSIIKYAELSLKDDPFDLQQMNYLIYAYKTKKKHNLAQHWQNRLNNILSAILSTGSGEKKENAWHVINIGHEYALINFMSPHYIVDHQEFIDPHFDHIILKQLPGQNPRGFYFNIQYMLDNYNRTLQE